MEHNLLPNPTLPQHTVPHQATAEPLGLRICPPQPSFRALFAHVRANLAPCGAAGLLDIQTHSFYNKYTKISVVIDSYSVWITTALMGVQDNGRHTGQMKKSLFTAIVVTKP